MRWRRAIVVRPVTALALAALIVLNLGLVGLNLSARGWLPEPLGFGPVPEEDAGHLPLPLDRVQGAGDGGEPAPAGPNGDPWPGGRGGIPDGDPLPRRVLIEPGGDVRLVGSAPAWHVVEDLVDAVVSRLERDPSSIVVEVGWHPGASPLTESVEVEIVPSLRYRAGAIELPAGGGETLEAVQSLLGRDPTLYAVVVGEVGVAGSRDLPGGGTGGDEAAAVVAARVTTVADVLVAGGVEGARVVTTVAWPRRISQPDPNLESASNLDIGLGDGERVVIRIGNLLIEDPGQV